MTDRVTEQMVTAALRVLRDEYELGGSANIHDYVSDGMTPDERAAGFAALRAEDDRLESQVRDVVRAALVAALARLTDKEQTDG